MPGQAFIPLLNVNMLEDIFLSMKLVAILAVVDTVGVSVLSIRAFLS